MPVGLEVIAVRAPAAGRGRPRRSALGIVRRHHLGIFGLLLLALVGLCALFAPLLTPHDPTEQELSRRLLPPAWSGGQPEHLLGTDSLGRDNLSRIIYGARVSLVVGFLTVLVSGAIGVLLGLVAGYYGKLVDEVVMRLADVQLAFPFILLAISVIAVLGPGLRNVIIVLGIAGWMVYARLVRGEVLSVKQRDFVQAVRCLGASDGRIILRHILPNVTTPLIVVATFSVAQMIIAEASLSFLGLGVQPPEPTWGGMLADGRKYLDGAWWVATFPGLAIMLTVLSVNFVGDWLRDWMDPRLDV
jgi:peptide/nickel transport system permease protein